MNKELIIQMAREAGGLPDPMVFIGAYERFFQLATEWEREQCINIANEVEYCGACSSDVAIAIRARGEMK